MTEPKYTPGPWTKADRLNGPWWHISGPQHVGPGPGQGRQAVACVHGESKRGAKRYAEMFEANAHLITAAPEMLDDLREAAATLRRYEVLHRAKGTAESDAKAEVNAALATRFEATIAKALGA